jgi:hypothetical protein
VRRQLGPNGGGRRIRSASAVRPASWQALACLPGAPSAGRSGARRAMRAGRIGDCEDVFMAALTPSVQVSRFARNLGVASRRPVPTR